MFRLIVGAFVFFLVIGAVFGNGDDEVESAPSSEASARPTTPPDETTEPDEAPSAEPAPKRAKDCVKVSPAWAHEVVEVAPADGYHNKVTGTAWAVRSKDFKKVWFVAVPATADGTPATPTFATTSLELGGGLIFAVDPFSEIMTQWGHGEDTDAEFSMYDHGAYEARDCIDPV